ncbi:MAG: hypothetical protein PHE02_09725 [Lachnospiraceae bacterium]|nr:hypothetical protein [Lachnospiraceae bacterium]
MLSVNVNEPKNEQTMNYQETTRVSYHKKSTQKATQENKTLHEDGTVLSISAAGQSLLQSKTQGAGHANTSNTGDLPGGAQEQNAAMEIKAKEKAEKAEKESYEEQVENSNEAADSFGEMAKMMEIARRISKGDHVPSKDEQKLMEFNSKLYQAAKAAAMLHVNEKHKKYKSILDEEENSDVEEKLRDLEQENAGEVIDQGDTGSQDGNVSIDVSDTGMSSTSPMV